MKKLNIVITLEVQDGENRYTLHSPKTIEIEIGKDQKEQINDFGELVTRGDEITEVTKKEYDILQKYIY